MLPTPPACLHARPGLPPSWPGCGAGEERAVFAYLAIWGAISLQGPHHVANQSTTTTGLLAMVSLKAEALEGTTRTHGQYRETRI